MDDAQTRLEQSYDENPERYLQRLANSNVCDGIQYEPRMWWNQYDFTAGGSTFVQDTDEIFYNGDQYPVRITHIVAAMAVGETLSPDPTPVQGDPRLIQRFGLRIQTHDAFYMSPGYIPLPLWHNVQTVGASAVAPGISSITFPRPFPLGQRQTWSIDVSLEQTPASGRDVGVTFVGLGRTSKRPYRFGTVARLTDTNVLTLNSMDLRSQGQEVVDITGMSLFCGAPIENNDAAGDIRQLRIATRSTGNGTEQLWEQGPITSPVSRAPAVLWGTDVSRAVVHELPVTGPDGIRGWLFQPGQGMTVNLQNFDATRQETVSESVWLGMVGYVIIT